MLYLIALLAIAAKAQTTDTNCGVLSQNCTETEATGAGVCVEFGGAYTCGACNTAADCTSSSYYSTFYTATYGDVDLDCYDLGEKSGTGATGLNLCYPQYCGDGTSCTTGSCILDTYCGVLDTTLDCSTCTAVSLICNTDETACVQCNSATDCDDGQSCTLGACIGGDSTSTTYETCSSTADCSVGACITVSGAPASFCIPNACNEDEDNCDSDSTCIYSDTAGYGVCLTGDVDTGCTKDADCSSPTPLCYNSADYSDDSFSYSICYLGCSSNDDCTTDGYGCQTDDLSGLSGCFPSECTKDSECDGVCNVSGGGVCVECNEAVDCGDADSYSCVNNACLSTSCSTTDDCGNYVCDTDAGACVICRVGTDADCTGSEEFGSGYTCQTIDGTTGCYGEEYSKNQEDGITQITTYIAMVIMAMVAVNM